MYNILKCQSKPIIQSEHSEEPSLGIPFSVGENIKTLTIGAEFRCIKHTLKKEPIRIVQRGLEAHKAGGGGEEVCKSGRERGRSKYISGCIFHFQSVQVVPCSLNSLLSRWLVGVPEP